MSVTNGCAFFLGLCFVILVWLKDVEESRITCGKLVTLLICMNRLQTPLRGLWLNYQIILSDIVSAEKMRDLLNEKPETEPHSGRHILVKNGEIKFVNVYFSYHNDDSWVIKDLTLTLSAGKTLAIVGPTGAGKSTLVKLIERFDDPQRGRITIDGNDLKEFNLKSLRNNIAIIPQVWFSPFVS